MAQTNHDAEIWEIIVEAVKWIIGLFVALVAFFLKGYYDEFKELKENDKAQGKILEDLKNSIESLSKDIKHLDAQVKTYANGDKIAANLAMSAQDDVRELKERIESIESKLN